VHVRPGNHGKVLGQAVADLHHAPWHIHGSFPHLEGDPVRKIVADHLVPGAASKPFAERSVKRGVDPGPSQGPFIGVHYGLNHGEGGRRWEGSGRAGSRCVTATGSAVVAVLDVDVPACNLVERSTY